MFIKELKRNQIFVFGSNLNGFHGAIKKNLKELSIINT